MNKGNKQRNFIENEIPYFVRSTDKNAKNGVFQTYDTSILQKDIMLGITAGARKKWKPYIQWMENIKSVTGRSVNNSKTLFIIIGIGL